MASRVLVAYSKIRSDVLRPLTLSTMISVLYVVVAGTYVYLSDEWVLHHVQTLSEFERWELFKGIGFVLVTGVLCNLLTFGLLNRIARQQQALLQAEEAMLQDEARATLGIFAASVAHDMANLVLVIEGFLARDDRARARRALADLHQLCQRTRMFGRTGAHVESWNGPPGGGHARLRALVR
jgi:signal transduction histidine kinase